MLLSYNPLIQKTPNNPLESGTLLSQTEAGEEKTEASIKRDKHSLTTSLQAEAQHAASDML